jgi:hypothetical protein
MKQRLRYRVFLLLFGVMLLCILPAVAIRLSLPRLLQVYFEKDLAKQFGVPVTIERLTLDVPGRTVAVTGLRIPEPAGAGGHVLLLDRLVVRCNLRSLFSRRPVMAGVQVNGCFMKIVRTAIRKYNVTPMIRTAASGPHRAARERRTGAAAGRIWRFEEIAVTNAVLEYVDPTVPGDPLDVRFTNLVIHATDLRVGRDAQPAEEPGTVQITARIMQRPYFPQLVGCCLCTGVLGSGVPRMNGALRVANMELLPVQRILPRNAMTLLGGDAVDLSVDLALAPDILDCRVRTDTLGVHKLSFSLSGTPAHPEFDHTNLLYLLLSRTGGGIGLLWNNVITAGRGDVNAAWRALRDVGAGMGSMVRSEGDGIRNTANGLARGDGRQADEGLEQSTVDVVHDAGRALEDAGTELWHGVVNTVDNVRGTAQAEAWRAHSLHRWKENWQAAVAWVHAMPFPPERIDDALVE